MKYPYQEGTAFLVPLRDRGYGIGVVARIDPKKVAILGYFFGPRVYNESEVLLNTLRPEDAILCVIFGAIGLQNGTWKILGQMPSWNRTAWPMPLHARRESVGQTIGVQYSDESPLKREREFPIDDEPSLPAAGLSGFGAVEIKLTKLLRERSNAD